VIKVGDSVFAGTVTGVSISNQAINDNGQIAFLASYAGGRTVIGLATPIVQPVTQSSTAFSAGQTPQTNGFTVGVTSGKAEISADPADAANSVLHMVDFDGGVVNVSK